MKQKTLRYASVSYRHGMDMLAYHPKYTLLDEIIYNRKFYLHSIFRFQENLLQASAAKVIQIKYKGNVYSLLNYHNGNDGTEVRLPGFNSMLMYNNTVYKVRQGYVGGFEVYDPR